MNLIFHKVRWKNFLSTGNYFLEIRLDGDQRTLVLGSNGSGKSTMLDAICFALFGVPFRKVNKPTLINSTNQKNCIVELYFSTEAHQYKVVRGLAPAIFEIYKDDVLIDQETSNIDYQEYLEKFILKFNFKSFTQIVILGSASYTPFMQLKASDRRDIIEDLLDIQIFSAMNVLVKKRLSSNKDSISIAKIRIDGVKEKEEMQKSHIQDLLKNKEEIIADNRTAIETSTLKIEELKRGISNDTTLREELRSKILDKSKIESAITKLVELSAQFKQTISKHEKNCKFFETNDTCPTCAQSIEEEFKANKLVKVTEKLSECKEALVTLNEKLIIKQLELSNINAIESTISTLTSNIISNNSILQGLVYAIEDLTQKNNILTGRALLTGKEHDKLREIQEELSGVITTHKELVSEKSFLEEAAELLKDSGIKTKIIQQYLPIINSLTNKNLAALDFFVNFTLDETFKETIKSRHRDEFTYHSFSEGQKMRIDMALMLTWREIAKLKNSVDTNLLILDEIFESSLDSTGADELMKIISLLQGNIFVISPRGDILQDKFSNTIRFINKQDFSHIAA